MPTVIECPSCGRQLRMPSALAGQLVRCPICSHEFRREPIQATGPATSDTPDPVADSSSIPSQDKGAQLNLSLDDGDNSGRLGNIPPPPRPMRVVPIDPQPARQPAADNGYRVPCPECGEQIQPDFVRCPFCGLDLDGEAPSDRRRNNRPRLRFDFAPHRGGLVLTLGIVSMVMVGLCPLIGIPFGIAAWMMGHADLKQIDAATMDPSGRPSTQAGKVCGMIGTVLDSLCSTLYGLMFFNGLH